MMKIFVLEKKQVKRSFRKLHNKKFHNLHSSSNRPYYKGDQIKKCKTRYGTWLAQGTRKINTHFWLGSLKGRGETAHQEGLCTAEFV
jgi:hypothetical protein